MDHLQAPSPPSGTTKADVTDTNPVLGTISVDGGAPIVVIAQRDPKIPWGQYGVSTVLNPLVCSQLRKLLPDI